MIVVEVILPSLFLSRVEIEQFGHHHHKHTFCADDAAFPTGVQKQVVWKPSCRDNSPDPGHSILGAVLNADPVGNAQFVFDQVNPLKANPLNGLAAIENTFSGLQSTMHRGINGMAKTVRRYSDVDKLLTRIFS